jgi:hypothetical protein
MSSNPPVDLSLRLLLLWSVKRYSKLRLQQNLQIALINQWWLKLPCFDKRLLGVSLIMIHCNDGTGALTGVTMGVGGQGCAGSGQMNY